jgi:hypothetical protein
MSGVDLATVKEIMRHKTIEMTLRYAHLSPEHKNLRIPVKLATNSGEVGHPPERSDAGLL